MKRPWVPTKLATAIALLGALAAGCSRPATPEPTPAQAGPKAGVYVKGLYSMPATMDPALMNETAALTVSNLIYDGLLRFTPDMEIKGAIAESWATSHDGKKITFQIRRDAKFQDGTPITAQDVKHSLERLMTPASVVYSYYDCIVGASAFHAGAAAHVSGIKVVSRSEVSVRLTYAYPPFLYVLAGATAKILPPHFSADAAFTKSPIGSGPFQFSRMDKHEAYTDLVLTAFDGYYGGAPKIKELTLRVMSDREAMRQARAGMVHDLAAFPLTGKEAVFSTGKDVTSPLAATWIIGMNTKSAPFSDLKTRQAFRQSLDTEAFRQEFNPDALPAHGYLPPGLPGYVRHGNSTHLANAKATTTVPIKVVIPEILARSFEMKLYLEKSLKAHGWNAEIVPMEWTKLMDGYSKKSHQAFLVSMNVDYPDSEFLLKNFESSNSDNFSSLQNRAVDSLLKEARTTQDRHARQEIYRKIQAAVDSQAVTVNLFHPRAHLWVSRCVDGFEPNIIAENYIDYRNVSVRTGCKPNAAQAVAMEGAL